jgi:putative NADH-flavin reductase
MTLDAICNPFEKDFIMKIALIGATGFVGSAVLTELLSRGHAVTALPATPTNSPRRRS